MSVCVCVAVAKKGGRCGCRVYFAEKGRLIDKRPPQEHEARVSSHLLISHERFLPSKKPLIFRTVGTFLAGAWHKSPARKIYRYCLHLYQFCIAFQTPFPEIRACGYLVSLDCGETVTKNTNTNPLPPNTKPSQPPHQNISHSSSPSPAPPPPAHPLVSINHLITGSTVSSPSPLPPNPPSP